MEKSLETIQLYSQEKLDRGVSEGEIREYSEHNRFKYLDCFDERPLTEPHQQTRMEPPARYSGAVTGVAIAGLAAIIAQYDNGHQIATEILEEHPHGIAGISAYISTHAKHTHSIYAHQHSADITEGNSLELGHRLLQPIGCKYAALVGAVAWTATEKNNIDRVNKIIDAGDYEPHDLNKVSEAFDAVTNLIGGRSASVTRNDLIRLSGYIHYEVPVSMVKGAHLPPEMSSAVYDFHGYCIAADGLEYVQSIKAPSIILKGAFHGLSLDDKALEQAGIINGSATQSALGVENTKIIPEGMLPSGHSIH